MTPSEVSQTTANANVASAPSSAPIPAYAFLTPFQMNAGFGNRLVSLCKKNGIDLQVSHDVSTYNSSVLESQNIVTWGMKKCLNWYRARNKNVLYTENGLLKQRATMTVDNRGYFSHSSMVVDGSNRDKPTADELRNLEIQVAKRLGATLFSGGNQDGPVLIALQMRRDAPLLFEFPAKQQNEDPRRTFLNLCRQYLPNHPKILIRPNPREKFDEVREELRECCPSHWEWHQGGDIFKLLIKCRAIVTINSTMATEALALGVPVATMGRSYFTGTNATLECHDDPSKLALLENHQFDRIAAERYLCSVLRNEISCQASEEEISNHSAVKNWIAKCKNQPANSSL